MVGNKLKSIFGRTYLYLESLPDRLYPFASEIEGVWVRGQQSYIKAVTKALDIYGPHKLGYKLVVYRGVFHFIGSILFISFSALISQKLFGSEVALYVLLGSATIAIFFQEFYFHPRRYQQSKGKGFADWLTWVVPMVLYVSLIHF